MTKAELYKKACMLPLLPGVYIIRDKTDTIIYIGKAKRLRIRVSQYFREGVPHDNKVSQMIAHADAFDVIVCQSEFEALVLECSLIKQHQPKYNILLKDDKGYNYIKITPPPFSKISECKQMTEDGSSYLGPYTSGYSVKQAVEETLKIYKLPRCNKQFPRDYGKSRPCLNGFMGICSAPCAGRISKSDFAANIADAVDFLKGGSAKAVKELTARMQACSAAMEFEEAAKLRDRIKAIRNLDERQKVVSINVPEEDVFALVIAGKKACFAVIRFENGRLTDSEHWLLDPPEDLSAARSALIERYYSMRDRVPARLEDKRGKKVSLIHPQKGEHLSIVQLCIKNANEHLAQNAGRLGREFAALEELAQLLGLPQAPEYIESYDISHTFGADNVAGMVVFHNGRPMKKAYKKFAIKGFDGQNDVGSMQEVLQRRFTHYREDPEDSTFKILPDLILLDGGDAQVHAVLPVLAGMHIDVPVFGMVKDSKHRTRAISTGGGEIQINANRQSFTLVSSIQEEVHRFAVSYHHQKHKKSAFNSTLLQIEGIGPAKAKALLKTLKTVTAVREATQEQLAAVPGISRENAKAVYAYYHGETAAK